MHDIIYIYMWVLALAEDMEARVLKSSAQTKGPGNTPRAKSCPTPDRRRGLQRQREQDGGCRANWFRRKPRDVFIVEQKTIIKKTPQALLLCCCTSINVMDGHRGWTATVGKMKNT